MGVVDQLINAMRINPATDEDYDSDELVDYAEPPVRGSRKKADDYDVPADSRPVSYNKPRSSAARLGNDMAVCVIKPTSVEDARDLTDTLLSNRTVVLNLEGLDVDIAQRIIDFTSGSCYALRGNLMKISHYIFVVTPESVEIAGDITASMGLDDSRGQSSYDYTGR